MLVLSWPIIRRNLDKDSNTFLSEEVKEELVFCIGNISNLNSFAISPNFPSITTCRMNTRDPSCVGLYVTKFTLGSRTITTK